MCIYVYMYVCVYDFPISGKKFCMQGCQLLGAALIIWENLDHQIESIVVAGWVIFFSLRKHKEWINTPS